MDSSRQCCCMPIAYRKICYSPLCDQNTLCTKCLTAKWGQESVMPIAKLGIKDAGGEPNKSMQQWRDVSHFVDYHGNFDQKVDEKLDTDASVLSLDASSTKIVNVILDARHPIFGSDYFSFLCAALRHQNDDMLRLMLSCDDFRQYCRSKLIGPKECYKALLVQQCIHWNSWECIEHFVKLGFFDEKQFTCKMLAHAAAINRDINMWTNMWTICFKKTFQTCWHKDLFAAALIAKNRRVVEFLMNLEQFSVCFCDQSSKYQDKLRYYWSLNQWTKLPSCLICMTNTMTIECKQDVPIAMEIIVPFCKTRRQRRREARKDKKHLNVC